MGEREVGADHALLSGNFRGAAMKTQAWPAARLTDDFDLEPVDSEADAGTERLGGGLFGGKTGGKALGGTALSHAIALLLSKIDAIEKTRPIAIHGVLDACDLDDIDSGAGNHNIFHATTKEPCCAPAVLGSVCNRSGAESCVADASNYPSRLSRCPDPQRLCQRRSGIVRVRDRLDAVRTVTDKRSVRNAKPEQSRNQSISIPWAMQMKAVSTEEPSRLVQFLTGAILGCGGWVLSRGANDTGMVNMLFEFERQACVDIYSVLIAAGLELSPSGHMRFTELCQCTRSQQRDCGSEIASIDLEVQTYPAEIMSATSNAGPV